MRWRPTTKSSDASATARLLRSRCVWGRHYSEPANIEIKGRQYEKAVETATRVIEGQKGVPAQRFQGHVVRARAILAGDVDRAACEHDVEAVLALLPELGPVFGEGRHGPDGLHRRARTAAHA